MMGPGELLEEVTRRFGLLADATRLKVLGELGEAGEASVGRLAELAGGTQHWHRLASGELCELVCAPLRRRRRQ